MTCNPERLSHYLDGELSPDEADELRGHLASCERCSAALSSYREVDDELAGLDTGRAPGELRRSVYRKIDRRRDRRARWGWATPLFTPLALSIAVIVLLMGGLAIWRSNPAGAPPVLTAAFAVQELPDSLVGLRLELVFDRPVAADSVQSAIRVVPPLPLSERVRENRVELRPETPVPVGGAYRLVVANVRDQHGNIQTQPVVLTLSAGAVVTVTQESSPTDLASAPQSPPRRAIQPGAEPAATTEPGLTSIEPATATTVVVGRVPASLDSAGAASRRPSTPDLPPERSLEAILESNLDLQQRFGSPAGRQQVVQLNEQTFQGGAMLTRADLDVVYVLVRSTGRWSTAENSFRPGEVLAPAGARPPGTLEPLRGFGKVWREEPAVRLQLGWPVYDERGAPGSLQLFEHGLLMRSSYGVIYALFDDGTWRTLAEKPLG